MPPTKKWSLKFDRCVNCGGNDVKHAARGLCLNCYERETSKRNRGSKRDKYDGSASGKLNYKYLYEEYVNKKRSTIDIAKDCDCGRQYVYLKMKKFNIPLRTLKEARELAYDRHKISYTIMDENGKEKLITQGSIKINENFFSIWSKEMAYVLGVLYTDGNLYHDSKRRLYRIILAQKQPELLNKVLKLMDCDARLRHRKKRGISGDIHFFDIQQKKIYYDLINFGLSPKKSKTIEFPNIPLEFTRHFVRGCWDGDGSIHIDGSKINAKYYCGSLNFIERLVQELYRIGIYKRKPPLNKTDAEKMWINYPDGKFPLKIHQEKRSKSYYIKLDSIENLGRLFHYLYDRVDPEQYLSRKYKIFENYFGKLEEEVYDLQLELPFQEQKGQILR